MNKRDYYDNQQNTLKQHLKEQNTKMRDKMQDSSVSMRTTWQQDKVTIYQKRPEIDRETLKRKEREELAKLARGSSLEFLDVDVTEHLVKTEKQDTAVQPQEDAEVAATVIEVPATPSDSGGRVVERKVIFQPPTAETVMEYQQQVSESRQRELDAAAKKKKEKSKVRQFLQKDDWMFFSKFIVIKSYDDYTRKVRDKIAISEITGVYLIANVSQYKMYVGCGSKSIEKCGQHFRMRLNSKDVVPEIRQDLLAGDVISVNFVKLKDTDFNTVKELADYYIHKYKCWAPRGYNPR